MTNVHYSFLGASSAPPCADTNGYIEFCLEDAERIKDAILAGDVPLNCSESSQWVGECLAHIERWRERSSKNNWMTKLEKMIEESEER